MRIKLVVSLFIFLLLFSAAWFLEQKNHLEYDVKFIETHRNQLTLMPLSTRNTEVTDNRKKLSIPFKPREYVRITGPEKR